MSYQCAAVTSEVKKDDDGNDEKGEESVKTAGFTDSQCSANTKDACTKTLEGQPLADTAKGEYALLFQQGKAHPRRPRGSQSGRRDFHGRKFTTRAGVPLGTYSYRTTSRSV